MSYGFRKGTAYGFLADFVRDGVRTSYERRTEVLSEVIGRPARAELRFIHHPRLSMLSETPAGSFQLKKGIALRAAINPLSVRVSLDCVM